jgi:hypothetical protein
MGAPFVSNNDSTISNDLGAKCMLCQVVAHKWLSNYEGPWAMNQVALALSLNMKQCILLKTTPFGGGT